MTSIQVLNEFVSATIRKGLLSKEKAIQTAQLIENDVDVVPLDKGRKHCFINTEVRVFQSDKGIL